MGCSDQSGIEGGGEVSPITTRKEKGGSSRSTDGVCKEKAAIRIYDKPPADRLRLRLVPLVPFVLK